MCYDLSVYLSLRALGMPPRTAFWFACNAFNLYTPHPQY